MAIMDSNEPFNPITGLAGGAAIGAIGAGGYIGAQALDYKTLPKRHEKVSQDAINAGEEYRNAYLGSPNSKKAMKRQLKKLDKAFGQVEKMNNHPYLKLGGGIKKTGIVAASAAGAGLIGAGAGYANTKWGD